MTPQPALRPLALAGALLAALPVAVHAQSASTSLPPTNQEIFAPLALPAANAVRRGGGAPGAEYWQQRADYAIRVSLDPEAHRVTGSATISYTNHSPDALDVLWVQLEQNLFRPGSRGEAMNAGSRWRGSFPGGGIEVGKVDVVRDGQRTRAAYTVDDTRMRIDLDRPLEPRGGRVELEFEWSFVVPEYGADRMGRLKGEDGWVYELAQWYPRMYVYDDVDGWNPMPYLGQGEFYLEYGDFDVEITVPREFLIVATGELLNADQVLTARQRERLERARKSAETVTIVGRDEVGRAGTRPEGLGPLTWRFRAENVRDFSWAASPAFILDGASWENVLLLSAYPTEGIGSAENPGWENSTQYLRHTIAHYSEQWFRYPYPVAVNVAGIVGGMEYPGIVFCSVRARGEGLFGVTDHEFGHTWFPMIVGSDERRWAWMDEGFNTFINHYSNLDFYGPEASRLQRTRADYIVEQMNAPIADQPIMTPADGLRRDALGFMAYRKPGYGLILLRELIVGRERFDAAFRTYIRRWAFRHPQPADFFRTIEEVTGEELDWFWRGWFYSTDRLDQAVDSVTVAEGRTRVHLSNRDGLVMPVVLRLDFADGRTERLRLPVEIWLHGDAYIVELEEGRRVTRVQLDPDSLLPDHARENDVWPRRGAATEATSTGGS